MKKTLKPNTKFKPVDYNVHDIREAPKAEDRTLLAKLAFDDPDRKSPLHDLGCAYVVERRDALVSKVKDLPPRCVEYETEHVLQTPSGFTVGFIDVLLDEDVIVEVKASRVAVGALVRQLRLYEAHMRRRTGRYATLVAALAHPISALDAQTLERERIHVFHLGAAFEKWCVAQKKRRAKVTEL